MIKVQGRYHHVVIDGGFNLFDAHELSNIVEEEYEVCVSREYDGMIVDFSKNNNGGERNSFDTAFAVCLLQELNKLSHRSSVGIEVYLNKKQPKIYRLIAGTKAFRQEFDSTGFEKIKSQ